MMNYFSTVNSQVLFRGQLIDLISEDGLLVLKEKTNTSIEPCNERWIELETMVGKMQSVFLAVFGLDSFIRWMPFNKERLVCYLFPAGIQHIPGQLNMLYKVQLMYAIFNGDKKYVVPLDESKIEMIKTKAAEILPLKLIPMSIVEQSLEVTDIKKAFKVLKQEIKSEEKNYNLKWQVHKKTTRLFKENCAFCVPEVREKQKIFETTLSVVLIHPQPYCDQHLMVIPNRHISTISENDEKEIIEKYALFERLQSLFFYHFNLPYAGVMTRIGCEAGQTQPHLHDHVIGFGRQKNYNWNLDWYVELQDSNNSPRVSKTQQHQILEENKTIWQKILETVN